MDKATRKRLEEAGFRVGDAGDFLGLTDEERELIELPGSYSESLTDQPRHHHQTKQTAENYIDPAPDL